PVIQPAELWQESGRWREYGPELLRIKDRHERDFVAGPTHEEVITDIVRREIRSYRQLPVNFYQIQTKFRDEIRPRFGVMRAREFTMKDAYSFDVDFAALQKSYQAMYDAYTRVFTRLGLEFRAVAADSGEIGGTGSHEFQVKATKVKGLKPFRFATDAEIRTRLMANPGSLGPVGHDVRIVADRTVAAMSDFCTGANEDGYHLTGVNFGRDLREPEVADIRNVVAGDASPDGKGRLEIARGIEVGHVFQLRTAYTGKMGVTYIDEKGETKPMEMGCYGIGVTRIVAAAIEQNHDDKGIIWPDPMAPFVAAVIPLGYRKSDAVKQAAEKLYAELSGAGLEVFLDDRDERAGVL